MLSDVTVVVAAVLASVVAVVPPLTIVVLLSPHAVSRSEVIATDAIKTDRTHRRRLTLFADDICFLPFIPGKYYLNNQRSQRSDFTNGTRILNAWRSLFTSH